MQQLDVQVGAPVQLLGQLPLRALRHGQLGEFLVDVDDVPVDLVQRVEGPLLPGRLPWSGACPG